MVGNDPLNVGIDTGSADSHPKCGKRPPDRGPHTAMNIRGNATYGQEIIERPQGRVASIKERRVRGRQLQSIDDQLPGETITRIVVAQG